MTTLADLVTIDRRFARSARLDADLRGTPPLVGYVLQGSTRNALTAMATTQAETEQGAYTWTGPYGGGKSSAALLVGNLVGGNSAGRKTAREIAGPGMTALFERAFPSRGRRWMVVPITGSRGSIANAVVESAAVFLKWPRRTKEHARSSNVALAQALTESAKACGGVLLLMDELGKFLEHAVGTDGDIHVLQDLAEYSSRSQGRLVLIGILHQSFDQYTDRLSRDARAEWSKVQGRFQDVSFLAGADETIGLLGRAITTTGRTERTSRLAERVAKAVAARRPTDEAALSTALSAVWPLNPVTALLLGPVTRQRFAQNERSVFGFLSSSEPCGFLEFLKLESTGSNASYGPERLWDYLATNFGMAIASGHESARVSLAFDAIDRASAKGSSLHVAITKCAAVIELFRNGSGVAVSDEFLGASLPLAGAADIQRATQDLIDWAVLISQPRLGGYAMFAGSDFDLDAALDRRRRVLSADDWHTLPGRAGLAFAVAKRHYFRTGALRAFDLGIRPFSADESDEKVASSLVGRSPRGSGFMLLLLADSTLSPGAAKRRVKGIAATVERMGAIAAVTSMPASRRLGEIAENLFALDSVEKEHPQLQGDRIARREIAARQSVSLDAIHREWRNALDRATWCLSPNGATIRDSLAVVATALADAAFSSTPKVKSELVQREQPSSNAMAAVRELGYAMVRHGDKEMLGMRGYPAEAGLYITLLRRFGLHRDVKPGVYRFMAPDDTEDGRSLQAAWSILELNPNCTLADVYDQWSRRPFGLKRGVMPVFALASILSRRNRLATYVDDVFQVETTDWFVDKLLQNPRSIRLRIVDRSPQEGLLLRELAKVFSIPGEPTALVVAQELFRRVQALPRFAKQTSAVSPGARAVRDLVLNASDPEALLFEGVPKLGLTGDHATALIAAIRELEEVYPSLLIEFTTFLGKCLGVDLPSWSGLADRAQAIQGLTNDLRFDAFAMRAGMFEDGTGDIEGLVSMLVHQPATNWSDRDREQALTELARFGRRFREAEALSAIRVRASSTEALALIVGVDPRHPPLIARFDLTPSEKKQAGRLAERLVESLSTDEAGTAVHLAALGRAVATLVANPEAG